MTEPDPTHTGVPWRSFLEEAIERLGAAGMDSPAVDARRVVEEAAGFEPSEFALGLDTPATVRGVARFDAMLGRRVGGEPLQYVLGRWAFRTLDLAIDPRVLIPRPETEVVTGFGLDALNTRRPSPASESQLRSGTAEPLCVADLGTGSGAIGLSVLAERPDAHVWCTDQSDDALAVARNNLAGLGRIGTRATLACGDWFEALPPAMRGRFDLVISNPPYVANASPELADDVRAWEPAEALFAGRDGLDAIRTLVSEAGEWLRPGGALVIEIGADQGESVKALASQAGLRDPMIRQDLAGRDRALVTTR